MSLSTHRPSAPSGAWGRVLLPLSQAPAVERPFIHPRFRQLPPPLILIGMHRAGTSVVASILAALGVYMGPAGNPPATSAERYSSDGRPIVDGYAEAEDFRQLNESLLARAGGDWNEIDAFLARRNQPDFARSTTALLQFATFGRLRRGYLRTLPATDSTPWGWKDPRSSLTLPLWLRLFPEARILHVRRDEDAIVTSLHRRSHSWVAAPGPPLPLAQRVHVWALRPGAALRRACHRFGLAPSAPPDPCLDRAYCRALSRRYVAECLRFQSHGDRYGEVSYDELLDAPHRVTEELACFAGTSPSTARISQAAALVRRS
jgi:Sulfotransferase family